MLVLYSVFWPENNIDTFLYVMSFPRANIGTWGKGKGENIAIFFDGNFYFIMGNNFVLVCPKLIIPR